MPGQLNVEDLGARTPGRAVTPTEDIIEVFFVVGKDGGIALRVEDSVVPGLHTVEIPSALQGSLGHFANAAGKLLFCVLPNPRESILTPLDDGEFGFFNKHIQLLPANSLEDLQRAIKGNAFGREFWRTLAIVMFVLMVLEIALTRWIAIRRKLGEEGRVLFDEALQPSTSFRDSVAKMMGSGAIVDEGEAP